VLHVLGGHLEGHNDKSLMVPGLGAQWEFCKADWAVEDGLYAE
jgi:hypothetical protein